MPRANGLNTEEICRSLGADSLGYISLDNLVEATTVPKERLCRACFDGVYPVPLPEPELLGKHLLELEPVVRPPSAGHALPASAPSLMIGNPGALTYDSKREEILVPN